MKDLEVLRKAIDQADSELLEALAARMGVVDRILRKKESRELPLFDKERESGILASIGSKAQKMGLDPRLAQRVIREVVTHAREVQSRRVHEGRNPELTEVRTVAYQGTKGAYSWLACRQHFGDQVEPIGYPSFVSAIEAVENGDVDVALLPIENVLAGSIYEVYDTLAHSRLYVIGEEILRIEHCLIGVENTPLDHIRAVLSHPKALQQCTSLIEKLPNAVYESYVDSAEAVRKVKVDGDPAQTAIASREAAELYGLEILRDGIADHQENYTRFWLISREEVKVDQRIPAKTSVFLVTEHREGALVACLSALAAQGVNLTKLESRPRIGMPWQYQFHLDMEGNVSEERMTRALDDVRNRARVLRILGCYPRADAEVARPPATVELPAGTTRTRAPRFLSANGNRSLTEKTTRKEPTTVWVGEAAVGGGGFAVMAGASALLSPSDTIEIAELVKSSGADILHGVIQRVPSSALSASGVSSGVDRLVQAGRHHHLPIAAEVGTTEDIQRLAPSVELLHVTAENMQNIPLLHEVGRSGRPVLLERGTSSTVQELLRAADYILAEGNQQVILCERGIRTFEHSTKFTLDLTAVVVLKECTHLPVIVDPSFAAGKPSAVLHLAAAARAAGADGVRVELESGSDSPSTEETVLSPEELVELVHLVKS